MANKAQLTRSMGQNEPSNWKPMAYGIGTIVGLLVGLIAAHLYTQAVEQNQDSGQTGKRPQISPLDMVSLGTMTLGVIRHITDLGARSANKN